MADTVRTRHLISGQIDENTPRHVAEHPILGKHLQIVDSDAKPYVPELYKAKTEPAPVVEIPTATETEKSVDVAPNKKNGKD